ncbi:two-component system chemotaxis response regulator CheB [Spirosoma lacussanchae]|uniref:chemotaxis protein CheB n=1 Tax=Spirosoma lacussanchae TaxID=1884249 RepID=UPI001109C307|nr:chemotaxis protein CheB [Spirosoma lacussanchae]
MSEHETIKRTIIVVGTSAGGVSALQELVAGFPADLGASIFVVQHVSADAPSFLPAILSRAGKLPASHPQDGDPIQPGHIYIAPPDFHLLIEQGRVLVRKGPKENRFRPSIDALFRSAAYTYGPRVIGVVLTGLLNDGTSGMWSVKRMGGVCVIQEPDDALYPSMPASVLEYVDVDYTVPLAEIASTLCRLIAEPVNGPPELVQAEKIRLQTEIEIAAQANGFELGIVGMGKPTTLTCPECNGVLMSIEEGKLTRYRCHTGHAFTPDSLLAELSKTVEETHWQVVRGLEEAVMLLEQMTQNYTDLGRYDEAERFRQKTEETRARARQVRKQIFGYGMT